MDYRLLTPTAVEVLVRMTRVLETTIAERAAVLAQERGSDQATSQDVLAASYELLDRAIRIPPVEPQ